MLIFLSGTFFLVGVTPSLHTLTAIADADCFDDKWLYLFTSSMVGWTTAIFVVELVCVFFLWLLISLYMIKPLYIGIWDPRVFLTLILIVIAVSSIGLAIEFTDVAIAAN